MNRKTVIIVTGPTAAGKTALALDLACRYKTDIISADSRQCYTELNIGVAKPSPEELARVRHYFINSHSIKDSLSAAAFEQYALKAAEEIFETHDTAIMVGGSGLYIRAFCEGLDEMPQIPSEVRDKITKQYNQNGLSWLQEQVRLYDSVYYDSGELLNPRRLIRALEIIKVTGRSIRQLQRQSKIARHFTSIKIGIDLPRQILYQRINERTDLMMKEGLLAEVSSLASFRSYPALQTVGYSELFNFLDGSLSLAEAIEKIKINTRHYARRQLTWFRKDQEIRWLSNPGIEAAMTAIEKPDQAKL